MASALARLTSVALAATLLLSASSSCLLERDVLLPFSSMEPRERDDGWPTMTPADAGFDEEQLLDLYEDLHGGLHWQLRSFLVFRHGHLITESYLKSEADLTQQRAVWSCTKQVLGVLVGIAIETGVLDGVDAPLSSCIEEISTDYPDKSEVRLEDLLEMRSGIAFSNEGAQGQTSQMLRQLPDDSARFILDLPMHAEPGTESAYNDGDPHLLSVCMQRELGDPVDVWAKEVLFDPLGFTNYEWVRYRDGTTMGGWGILTTPRELAKVGQLVLQNGLWQGTQLVSSDWIAEMTAARVDAYDDRYRFGYQWWHYTEHDLSFMNGHGGQFVFLDRSTDTMVVMTSEPNTQGDHQLREFQGVELVLRVLGAIEE